MLSYQHGYHAGNFADVIKHLTLTHLMDYLLLKDKSFVYIETHSGRGLYDLNDKFASKTAEFLQGISPLWQARQQAPSVFSSYLASLKELNPGKELRYYPGSPYLASTRLRPEDRAVFFELHPREFEFLERLPKQKKRIFYHNKDGIKELNAFLPPIERRGLIFIDPSYELKEEYKQIPAAVKNAYNRFSTGVYCLWYPIVDNKLHQQLLRGLEGIDASNALQIEFLLTPSRQEKMSGCGLWIINPPYTLSQQMEEGLKYLRTLFNPGVSDFQIKLLG